MEEDHRPGWVMILFFTAYVKGKTKELLTNPMTNRMLDLRNTGEVS